MEIRTAVESTVKDIDGSKREVVWEFPHEKVDTFKTTFGPTAFEESFRQQLPVICWQHMVHEPLGRIRQAQITPRVNEVIGKFSDFNAVPLAHRAYTQIEDGSLPGVSFGFERQADERHPEQRGVTRITKAKMREVSPVTFPSIPGALATGVRQEVPEVEYRTILDLVDRKVVSPEEARAMLAAAGVEFPESRAPNLARDPAREGPPAGQGAVGASEVRPGMVLVGPNDDPSLVSAVEMPNPEVVQITYKGQASAVAYHPRTQLQLLDPANPLVPGVGGLSATQAGKYATANRSEENRDDGDAGELAAAVDAALDEAQRSLDAVDTTSLPPEVQQAAALIQAAGAAVDDLLEVMGVADADEPAGSEPTGSEDAMAGRGACADWIERGQEFLGHLSPELREQVQSELLKSEARSGPGDEHRVYGPNGEYRRDIGQAERDKIKSEDFAGKGTSFPIVTPDDVDAASKRIGTAGSDNFSEDQLKANIIRIAKRKGAAFVAKLPDAWKQDDAKQMARQRAAQRALERRAS